MREQLFRTLMNCGGRCEWNRVRRDKENLFERWRMSWRAGADRSNEIVDERKRLKWESRCREVGQDIEARFSNSEIARRCQKLFLSTRTPWLGRCCNVERPVQERLKMKLQAVKVSAEDPMQRQLRRTLKSGEG